MDKTVRGLRYTRKGGEGSGWHGPPKGDHIGRDSGLAGVQALEQAAQAAKTAGLKELPSIRSLEGARDLSGRLEDHGLAFYSKRSGKSVIAFRPHFNPKKVDYLYDDGVSKGTARYENLYKVLTIR